MSVARFKVNVHIDGSSEATLTIDRDKGFVEVRPKGKRRVYRLLLPEVVEMIAWRAAKKESF